MCTNYIMMAALVFNFIAELFPFDLSLIIGHYAFDTDRLEWSFILYNCVPHRYNCSQENRLVAGCIIGDFDLVENAIFNGASEIGNGLFHSTSPEMFRHMAGKITDRKCILRAALRRGMKDFVGTWAIHYQSIFNASAYANACKNGDETRLDKFTHQWPDHGLYGACRTGNYKLACKMIGLGATDFNVGLYGACKGGYVKVAQLMILSGATNFDDGYGIARLRGNDEIADLMIAHGATIYDDPHALATNQDDAHDRIILGMVYRDA